MRSWGGRIEANDGSPDGALQGDRCLRNDFRLRHEADSLINSFSRSSSSMAFRSASSSAASLPNRDVRNVENRFRVATFFRENLLKQR